MINALRHVAAFALCLSEACVAAYVIACTWLRIVEIGK